MRFVLAAALMAVAACKSAPALPPAPVATLSAAGVPDAGPPGPGQPASAAPLLEQAQAAWEQRLTDPGALDRAISSWEEAALAGAEPAATLLSAARARRTRMDRFVQNDPEVSRGASADAQVCAAEAHRSWAAQFPEATSAPVQFVQIGESGIEALYLEAVCTAAWARLQGFTPLIDRRGDLLAAFTRVAQLSPELDGAGAERELGALLAALPAYAGGDLREARRHLEAAIRAAPQEGRNHLVLARTVAVKSQDRALFEGELRGAVQSSDATVSAQASALLQREDDLFGTAEAAQPIPGGAQK